MLLWFTAVLLLAGAACFPIDRPASHYFREHLNRPLWRFGFKITDWAKGGPWIAAAALVYIGVQAFMAASGETPDLREASNDALALLASFVAGSVVLHVFKIFVGRRRPRDDAEHGLYGFKYFTWELQYDSFPSGHAMTIFCVAVILSAVTPALAPLWLLLATFFGLLRAFLTAHFLSDVMVGAAIGILTARETLMFGFPQMNPGWF
jgi:membrane-associated phospholipid phosphatase